MTPETVSPEPAPAEMGAFSRIAGVLFEPGKTFADIGRRPSWLLPLLLVIVAGVAYYAAYGQHVGWNQYIDQQVTLNPRMAERMQSMTPEQKAMQAKFTGIGFYASGVVFVPIVMLISSAILLGITAMMSAGLRYKQVFAVVCFAAIPAAIKHLLSIVVVFLKKPEDFNLMNPLAFNIAAFMDPLSSSKFLYTFAISFDLFAIWTIVLTAIGLSAAAGPKKLSFGGALVAVLIPWIVFVSLAAGMSAAFR